MIYLTLKTAAKTVPAANRSVGIARVAPRKASGGSTGGVAPEKLKELTAEVNGCD